MRLEHTLRRLACLTVALTLAYLLPVAQGIKGDSQCSSTMCVHAFDNGTQWTYQMQAALGEQSFGWMAIGFGTSMTNSQMVIMWPNKDGTVTVSQRKASAHSEPKVDSAPLRTAQKDLVISTQNQAQTFLAFTVPPNGEFKHNIVWAISRTRPPSGAVDARLSQHVAQGSFTIDLTKEFTSETLGNTPTSPPSGSTGSVYHPPGATNTLGGSDLPVFQLPSLQPYQRMLVVHAVLCSIGFLLVLPVGALVARWLRTFNSHWFKAHWIVQLALGGPIIVAGWGLGVAAIVKKKGTHFDDTHKVAGLVLFGIYILQVLLGVYIHMFKPKSWARPIPISAVSSGNPISAFVQMLITSSRPFQNYLHAVFGLAIISIAFYNVWLGLDVEWAMTTGRGEVPDQYKRLWLAWVIIIPTAYFVGLALLPRQLSQERRTQQSTTKGTEALPLKPSPPSTKKSLRGVKISKPIPVNEEEEWKRQNEFNPSTEFTMGGTTTPPDRDVPMSEEGHGSPLRQPAVGYTANGI